MPELPSVCVIGAGVSGLTACKALGDFGVPHSCFEASDEVGGNWYFQNPNGVSSA
ncbi:MAG TPA: NAD(P)-binding protein, partial [Solirubrobacteraceae bacterium]|nr:NAD(P)-binding protein [Solirubrobacteraceae bacterium]